MQHVLSGSTLHICGGYPCGGHSPASGLSPPPVFSLLSGCGPLSPAQGCGKCINIYLVLMFVSINNGYY